MPMADRSELRTWSFLSLLVGGILIVVGGLLGPLMMGTVGWVGAMPMNGMMNAYAGDAWVASAAWWMGGVGIITGAFVLIAAYNVNRGRDRPLWSTIAIVAGALSLFAMGGYMLGAIAAITGGVLGLVDQQRGDTPAGPRDV